MIFNELKHAETMLEKGFLQDKYLLELKILAKYFHKQKGFLLPEVKSKLKEFCIQFLPGYNEVKHLDILLKAANYGVRDKNILIAVPPIFITERELDLIQSQNNNKVEKLLFSMLILAKANQYLPKKERKSKHYYDQEGNLLFNKPKEQGWYVNNVKEAYKCSNCKWSKEQKAKTLQELQEKGFIKLSELGTIQINYIEESQDHDNNIALTIHSLDHFILEYERLKGENIVYCHSCGKPVKKSSNRTKYCKSCRKDNEKKKKREWKSRQVDC